MTPDTLSPESSEDPFPVLELMRTSIRSTATGR